MSNFLNAQAIAAFEPFQIRVRAALISLAKANLSDPDLGAMAENIVRQDGGGVVHIMAAELARGGIDMASSDAAISAALIAGANLDLLKAAAGQ